MLPTSSPTFTRSDLLIREAQPADRAALEAIAAQTWEGNDYLPRVIDEWLADPYGGFYVAVLPTAAGAETVIGAIKVTRFAPGEWWMEGLRIDPAYRGYGFGRILHHYAVRVLRQNGEGEVRFATGSMNLAVQQLAQETGFERTAVFLPYAAEALAEPVQGWVRLGADDLPRAMAWLDRSAYTAQSQRSLEWDWSYYRITAERLSERLGAGLVWGWPGQATDLCGVLIANPTDKDRWPGAPVLKVAHFDADPALLVEAARDIRRVAVALERGQALYKVLNAPERVAALEEAGFAREWEGEVWLYARAVVLTQHAEVRVEHLPR